MLLALVPAQPAGAQGMCKFCATNPPPQGQGGGRPSNGPGTPGNGTPGSGTPGSGTPGSGNGAGGNGNGNNGNGNGNGGSNQIALSIESEIDFGRMVMIGDGIGRVLIDLQTGNKTVFGNLNDLGGIAVQGRALITGTPMRPVIVNLPTSIVMTDPAGGQAELRDFTTDLPALPSLNSNGTLEFHFTGTLYTTSATALGGTLRGRVPIMVDYN